MALKSKDPHTYTNLAFRILKKNKNPMNYIDLTEEILKIKKSTGKTPQETLRILLKKDNRFKQVGQGLWKVKKT